MTLIKSIREENSFVQIYFRIETHRIIDRISEQNVAPLTLLSEIISLNERIFSRAKKKNKIHSIINLKNIEHVKI